MKSFHWRIPPLESISDPAMRVHTNHELILHERVAHSTTPVGKKSCMWWCRRDTNAECDRSSVFESSIAGHVDSKRCACGFMAAISWLQRGEGGHKHAPSDIMVELASGGAQTAALSLRQQTAMPTFLLNNTPRQSCRQGSEGRSFSLRSSVISLCVRRACNLCGR